MTPGETVALAQATLAWIGPDPDAARHRADLVAELAEPYTYNCAITGCEKPHRSLGLCETHRSRHRRVYRNQDYTIKAAS